MIHNTSSGMVADWWRRARPDLDTSAMELFGRLRRLQIIADIEADSILAGVPFSSSELDVLVILRHSDHPMIARSIAELRGCSRAAITNVLNKLEGRGIITRTPNPADRRATLILLSEEGTRLVDEVFPRRLALEADLLAQLGPGDQDKIIESLDMLLNAMLRRAPLKTVPESR